MTRFFIFDTAADKAFHIPPLIKECWPTYHPFTNQPAFQVFTNTVVVINNANIKKLYTKVVFTKVCLQEFYTNAVVVINSVNFKK